MITRNIFTTEHQCATRHCLCNLSNWRRHHAL